MGAEKSVPLGQYKRTKIIVTLRPDTTSFEAVKALIAAGANGLNLGWIGSDTHEDPAQTVAWIRRASQELKKPVAIVQELRGPALGLGDFEGIINIRKGQMYRFGHGVDWPASGIIPTRCDLSKLVQREEPLLLHDGRVRLRVTSVKEKVVYAEAETDGILIRRRAIHLPDTDLAGKTLTESDRRDLVWASEHDVDYVMTGSLRAPADVHHVRRELKNLGSDIRIIARIETRAAAEDLESIVQASDALLVARDTLSIEVAPESVPLLEQQIARLGKKYARPVVVTAELLARASDAPEPGRAEVSDIATAVLLGVDGVFLSTGAADNQPPLERLQLLKRIVRYSEAHGVSGVPLPGQPTFRSRQAAICATVVDLARAVEAQAIVAETKSGATVQQLAADRPEIPLLAICSDTRIAQQLAIVYGVKSYIRPLNRLAVTGLMDWLQRNDILKKGDIVVTASGHQPGVVGTTDTIKVRQLD